MLGKKQRGHGRGLWNGFGGKVMAGESITDAAVRECQEECHVVPLNLEKRAVLSFVYDQGGTIHETHAYHSSSFEGVPAISDEMDPQWFTIEDIPYDSMWPDDKIWLPLFLAGKQFIGEFVFTDTKKLLRYTIRDGHRITN